MRRKIERLPCCRLCMTMIKQPLPACSGAARRQRRCERPQKQPSHVRYTSARLPCAPIVASTHHLRHHQLRHFVVHPVQGEGMEISEDDPTQGADRTQGHMTGMATEAAVVGAQPCAQCC